MTQNIFKINTNASQIPSLPSLQTPFFTVTNYNIIKSRVDFTLSHFEEPVFPRKISTFKSNNSQFLVRSRKEIVDSFIDSNFVDCQINAYPFLTEYKDVPRYKPEFLFIDLDRKDFKNESSFELALKITLKNIKNVLNGEPTVLLTGGGYHIYQPVFCPTALENITEFKQYDKPSEQFLRFAKEYLSNGKADKKNNSSFRSCLVRVPGSIRSKYDKPVLLIKKWNGVRPNITKEIIEDFRSWLIQKEIDERIQREKISIERSKNRSKNKFVGSSNYYTWIENLLNVSIHDYRKLVMGIVIAPYLINVRNLSFEESYNIIRNWLDKCNELEPLDNYRNFDYRIKYALKNAMNKQIGPMSLEKIKTESAYTKLYQLLKNKGVLT